MNSFRKFLLDEGTKRKANYLKRYRLAVFTAIIGLMLILTASAQSPAPFSFTLTPPAGAISNCLPNATANVTVFPKQERRGVDTLDLKAAGLPANTEFAVFLTEGAVQVGAVQFIGDFTTNADGRGSMRVDTIVNEAFASSVTNGVRSHTNLNHMVIWFADQDADNFCFTPPATGPVTPFDGDGQAGAAVLSSANLPIAPLP